MSFSLQKRKILFAADLRLIPLCTRFVVGWLLVAIVWRRAVTPIVRFGYAGLATFVGYARLYWLVVAAVSVFLGSYTF